jgi:hypothetical protein
MSDMRPSSAPAGTEEFWPSLPLEAWESTYATLHRWLQVVGKIRLKLAPMTNHWWQVALYVTSRGLSTSPIACGPRIFQIDFDFLDHEMLITTDAGAVWSLALAPRAVADFYAETMDALRSLGIDVSIWTTPVEIPDRTPFEQDRQHAAYDPEYARRFWRILVQTDRVLKEFRGRYLGKVSPVHLFWGALDMAVTRFSGRRAPEHPGSPNVGRSVMVEAYSHEVSSCDFWPGAGLGLPAFYAYAYPEPPGFPQYPIQPAEVYYHPDLHEFILPYDAVRTAASPDETLLAFCQTTYEAAAVPAQWNRPALERSVTRATRRSPAGTPS